MRRWSLGSIVILAFLLVNLVYASGSEITVCSSGCDYTKIQSAVNAAGAGDTILVKDGTYIENVKVSKSVTIKSENGYRTTIVRAKNTEDHVFEVEVDYVNISGFTAADANHFDYMAGIYLENVNYCNISYNRVLGNNNGILCQGIWR